MINKSINYNSMSMRHELVFSNAHGIHKSELTIKAATPLN